MKIRHILVPSDLSPHGIRPVQPIAELALELGAKITLLHVLVDLKVAPLGAPLAPMVSSSATDREVREARAKLDEQRAMIAGRADVDSVVIRASDVARAIVHYAKEHAIDLIAVSTHGHTGLRHLALGSVAEAVLRLSEVPVISFHRPKG